MEKQNPKAFICHVGEDKQRFVLDLGRRLRQKGVDALVAEWEINITDSLRRKIFEEGIKNCDVFIVVLSKNSIDKDWAKEELDAGPIKKIEDGAKLLTVITDNIKTNKMPMSLRYTLWIKINDVSNYDEEFDKILKSIYDVYEKLPLGEPPKFSTNSRIVSGLTKIDSIVLKALGDIIHEGEINTRTIGFSAIQEKAAEHEISEGEIINSLEILESKWFLKLHKVSFKKEPSKIEMFPSGFVNYCKHFLEGFNSIFKDIVAAIINEKLYQVKDIVSTVGCKPILVNFILDYFHSSGYINRSQVPNNPPITDVTSQGKRYFSDVLNS